MFRWPTSEFPICPRGRPTASSEASIVVCAQERHRRSQFGLTARLIALSGASSRHPTPSRISSTTGTTGAAAAGCSVIGEWAIALEVRGFTLSFYLYPLHRPRTAAGTRVDTSVSAEQLAAGPGHARFRSDAGVAADRQPAVHDARNRRRAGNAADQSQGRADPRLARGQGIRRRPRSQCAAYPAVAARQPGEGARQVHGAAADRVLQSRQSQPECGRRVDQARVQGNLRIARWLARLDRGGAAAGEGVLVSCPVNSLDSSRRNPVPCGVARPHRTTRYAFGRAPCLAPDFIGSFIFGTYGTRH